MALRRIEHIAVGASATAAVAYISGLKPHDDLQAQFPYLGVPNPLA
jgi:hypothetical protein